MADTEDKLEVLKMHNHFPLNQRYSDMLWLSTALFTVSCEVCAIEAIEAQHAPCYVTLMKQLFASHCCSKPRHGHRHSCCSRLPQGMVKCRRRIISQVGIRL